jgi:hypothetical protein
MHFHLWSERQSPTCISMIKALASFAAIALCVSLAAPGEAGQAAQQDSSGLSVEFSNCIESIGVGLIPTDTARALVPPEFVLAGEGQPVTPIVVRTAYCTGIAVGGHKPKTGAVVQIGAVIIPPDFTGDINNYTFWYYTSDAKLAQHLQRLGVSAQHVPTLDYQYDAGGAGNPSPLHVGVRRPGRPPLSLEGTVVESEVPAGSFEAVW